MILYLKSVPWLCADPNPVYVNGRCVVVIHRLNIGRLDRPKDCTPKMNDSFGASARGSAWPSCRGGYALSESLPLPSRRCCGAASGSGGGGGVCTFSSSKPALVLTVDPGCLLGSHLCTSSQCQESTQDQTSADNFLLAIMMSESDSETLP